MWKLGIAVWRHSLHISLLAACAHAFAPAPIVWRGLPGESFFLAPKGVPSSPQGQHRAFEFRKLYRNPQPLMVWKQRDEAPLAEIPHFKVNSDKTITWDGTDATKLKLCMDASGDKSGDTVRVARCTGERNQVWNVLPGEHGPTSRIQLDGTNKCLDINHQNGERGSNGAPAELQECQQETTDSWRLEEQVPLPTQSPSRRFPALFSIRHVKGSFIALASFGLLSLSSLLWWTEKKARAAAALRQRLPLNENASNVHEGVICGVDEGGVCLMPLAGDQDMDGQKIVPAAMTFALDPILPLWEDDVVATPKVLARPERYRSSEFLLNARKTFQSSTLRRVRLPVVTNILCAIFVAVAHRLFGFPAKAFPEIHALIGSALGLLLVFRTRSSYQRFWEGCQQWEDLLNHSRNLARLTMLYSWQMPKRKVRRMKNLICAFSIVLAKHLGQKPSMDHKKLLTIEDLKWLTTSTNQPLWLATTLSREIKSIPDQYSANEVNFSSRERLSMLGCVEKMTRCLGACERLVQLPVPLNYPHHTGRFLGVWTLTLPLALVGQLGFGVVPIMGLMSWILFGIQEIGLMIEDPFDDHRCLDLDKWVMTICEDVDETCRMTEEESHLGGQDAQPTTKFE